MTKSIVTGAGGFIGHHLVHSLKKRGHEVIGIDLKRPEFALTPADRFLVADMREKSALLAEVFEGADEVWALAADMGGMGYISKNHATIMSGNVIININTLELACQARVKKLLYTSSACVYPETLQTEADVVPLAESMAYPAQPQDGYGWEKLYTEKLCEYYALEYGLDIRIVRFHNIYGPLGTWKGGREKAPAAICRKVAEAVRDGKDSIEIWGDGEQTRSFCYIDDCLEGLGRVMSSSYRQPLNLGRDEMVSINQLADLAMRIAGVQLQKIHVEGPMGVRGRNSDNSLFYRQMGWKPGIDLETGMRKTYEWIRDQVNQEGRNHEAGPKKVRARGMRVLG